MTLKPVAALVIASLAVSGCSGLRESRANPFNWFGGDREEQLEVQPETLSQDSRPLVSEVSSITIEPVPEGAILRAIGLPRSQGFWEVELVEQKTTEPGVLVYEFRSFPPVGPRPSGTVASRELIVARALSQKKLAGVQRIVVIARENQRSISR